MKNTTFLSGIFLLTLLLIFAACQFQPNFPKQSNQPDFTESEREFLAILKARDKHTVSVEVLQEMVIGLLNQAEPKSDRSVALAEKTVITRVEKFLVTGEKQFSASFQERSALGEDANPEAVEVYTFITENPGNEPPGYVLACNDIRIGNILAVVEEGSLDNEELAWFTDIVHEGLAGYIDRIIEEYDSITEEEVGQAVGRSAARYMNINQGGTSEAEPYESYGYYKALGGVPGGGTVVYADWSWFDGYYTYNPVEWNQGVPYNYVVNAYKKNNGNYPTGCVPTALAQLMAYHRRPLFNTWVENIPALNKNYFAHIYNWGAMTSTLQKSSINDPGALDIAVLMYEIGRRGNAVYTTGITEMTPDAAVTALKAMGYTTPNNFSSYNYTNVKSSIQNNRPVLTCGTSAPNKTGHMWLIDGVRTMSYSEQVRDANGNIWTFMPGRTSDTVYGPWVHCNIGWGGGSENAWYRSGIFDCRNGYQAHAKSVIERYYQYELMILPNVRPQ